MFRFVQVLLILGVAFAAWSRSMASRQPVAWGEDIPRARQESYKTQKPLFVYFSMPGCHYCEELEAGVLRSPAVRAACTGVTPLKVDITTTEGKRLAEQYQIPGAPVLAIIGRNGRLLDNLDARATEEDVVGMLKSAAQTSR